jgi:tetratricopeptide (TPR) repeat protein
MSSGCDSYVRRHADQGDVYFKDRKYREAVAEYDKAIRFSPDDPHIVRQLGLAHFSLGEPEDAFAYLTKSELLKPGDPEVSISLGKIYLANRRPDDAVREAKLVLASDPRNADALDVVASAYLNQNDPAMAIETYRRLVELFPRSAERHYALGVSLVAAQRNADARRELETALGLAPDHLEAVRLLVNLDLLEKRPDAALARVEKQIAVAGRTPKLVLLLAGVQGARGDQASAEAIYQEAIRLDPGHTEASVALANFYLTTGKLDQALALIESALTTEKSANAYELRGIILQSKGDPQGARKSYEQALALNPRHVEAANNLAWLLSEKLGDNQKAFSLAETAYQSAPNDPHIADTFGWIVYRTGDVKRAVTLLTASAEKLPNAPGIQYHLGMALLGVRDTTGARRALARAVNSPTPFDDKAAAQKVLGALK